MAAAKEVIATPIPTKEVLPTPIVVCPEIVPEWRPTGYIDLQAKYYGQDEHSDDLIENIYTRTTLEGAINLTEKSKFDFRARNYVNLKENDRLQKSSTTSNNMRFRYSYNHGLLGDSKVNFISRVEYYNNAFKEDDTHNLEYQARLEFAPYFDFMPSWASVSSFIVAPKLGYQKTGVKDSDYNVNTGLNLYTYTELPLGIDLELNMFNTYSKYGTTAEFDSKNGKKDNQFDVGFEAYLYKNFELYTAGKNKLELTTEFGYETYDTYQSNSMYDVKEANRVKKDNNNYKAYALTGLKLTHQYSKTLNVYAWAGGEYKNRSEASDWGWQPQVTVGFRSTF
ncbi:MAG: FomA family porin-like outer membrane protein, partial [Cetobacterium sp.]